MAFLLICDKSGVQLEQHEITGDLITWLRENVPNYQDRVCPPYWAKKNGSKWAYCKHNEPLAAGDYIELFIQPQDPATIFYVAAFVLAGYAAYTASQIPTYQDSTESGQSIYSASARANNVKPNGVIREVAGNIPIYPDLICPVRYKYIDNEEYLFLNLAVGVGRFKLDISNLYISETPLSKYAGDILLQISKPGDDISGHLAHENWFQSEEINNLKMETSSDMPEGEWTIDTATDQITAYESGNLTTFPFPEDTIFSLTSDSNTGYYRVDSVSGTLGETATVVQQNVTYEREIDPGSYKPTNSRRIYTDADSTTLTTATAESASWNAVSGGNGYEGPFEIIPETETTQKVELDFLATGLGRLNSDGTIDNKAVVINYEWRDVGSDTWNARSFTASGATLDDLGFTVVIEFDTPIRPEMRFQRGTAEENKTDVLETVNLVRVRGLLNSPISYDDVTTVQLRLRGTNALAQTAQNKISVRGAMRCLPTLTELKNYIQNGTDFTLTDNHATSSIMRFVAWQMWYVSRQDKVDWNTLEQLESLLEPRGDELNMDFSDQTTLWEALKVMLAPGYCEPATTAGKLKPVRFAATDEFQHFYPASVMLDNGLQREDTYVDDSEPAGIIAEYIDSSTGQNETVNCFMSGDSEELAKRIQVKGITDRTRAWRYGMRMRREARYKPASLSFKTGMSAFNSDYGSADALSSPLEANQFFFVIDANGANIELDTPVKYESQEQYYAVFRKPNGDYSGMYTISPGTSSTEIVLNSPSSLDFTPVLDGEMEDTACAIGTEYELIQRVFIMSVSPNDRAEQATVSAKEYIPEIFADDDNFPE